MKNSLLIVEDSAIQSKIIAQRFAALTTLDLHVVHSLTEAENAVAEFRDELFGAVVDLNLPDAPDGEAVDMCLGNGVPCVVLAATFDEDLRRKFLDKRVSDYFLKGTIDDLEPLISSVQRLHDNYAVKALVVDDSNTQRSIVRRMLEVQCIESVEAKDGVDALEVLEEHRDVRLVITDFNMPRMDGITLVQEIRARFRENRMAVIGLSSTGSGPLTAQFLKHGANDFLTKPFEAEEFYWRVNQTLNTLDALAELKLLRSRQ
ncbi:response regulator [Desulfovibrio sp. OttesenSCG-928-G15]|nr:response regulator [Desulfovibrio sp. OttesenSCG-928-G15]